MYLGSDAIALAPLTDMINYLEDGDVAVITRQGIDFLDAKGECLRRSPAKIAGSAVLVAERRASALYDQGNSRTADSGWPDACTVH